MQRHVKHAQFRRAAPDLVVQVREFLSLLSFLQETPETPQPLGGLREAGQGWAAWQHVAAVEEAPNTSKCQRSPQAQVGIAVSPPQKHPLELEIEQLRDETVAELWLKVSPRDIPTTAMMQTFSLNRDFIRFRCFFSPETSGIVHGSASEAPPWHIRTHKPVHAPEPKRLKASSFSTASPSQSLRVHNAAETTAATRRWTSFVPTPLTPRRVTTSEVEVRVYSVQSLPGDLLEGTETA